MRINHSFLGAVDFHFGRCIDCHAHSLVFNTQYTDHDLTGKEVEKNGPRCVLCIWVARRDFKWKRRTIEDSPLYVAPPAISAPTMILDARGRPFSRA